MKPFPKISPAEWEIMDVVWDNFPIPSSEVLRRLPSSNNWKQKTVNTFLTRLVDKGVLSVKKEGKANLYSAQLGREECVQSESQTFLQRVFKGALAPMVLHFVENADLSDQQIKELQNILKKR